MGDKLHLKLNISEIPIANKYREGKMQRTLKRELKESEIAEREAIERESLAEFKLLLTCSPGVDCSNAYR